MNLKEILRGILENKCTLRYLVLEKFYRNGDKITNECNAF